MKKIIIPTLLTLASTPLLTMVSCGKEPQESPSDTREWDYSNGYLCEARNYPLEGLDPQKHAEAIKSYLTATAEDPRGFVDDLFLAENYNYLTYYSYLGAGLKKYKVKFTVSDLNPGQKTASVHVMKDVKIQKGTGPEMDITIDLEINKLPYASSYSIDQERITGAALPVWSFSPTYKRFSYDEFADKMAAINTGWSINGQILIETEGVAAQPIIYDWNADNIKDKEITEKHYADLIDSYSAIPASYYFSYLDVASDIEFEWNESDNAYEFILDQLGRERKDNVYVFKASDRDEFDPGAYHLTLFDDQTGEGINSEYIVMDYDENYFVDRTISGRFSPGLYLNNDSYLIFTISDVASEGKQVKFVLGKDA